ncbi:hypothetical protein EfsSVR2332_01300 [Enterococcus faecalis]|uniref:Uncharacterized protein n=1 Tax=Enterococcus faecalis TaxID=1351 RepID=A0AC59HK98_ENTFL|nr:hypothetical protein EfsSVR2332_01300 [Enterococcus faecalis]
MNNEDLVLKMILDESGFSQGLNSAVKKLQGFDVEVDRTGQKRRPISWEHMDVFCW